MYTYTLEEPAGLRKMSKLIIVRSISDPSFENKGFKKRVVRVSKITPNMFVVRVPVHTSLCFLLVGYPLRQCHFERDPCICNRLQDTQRSLLNNDSASVVQGE